MMKRRFGMAVIALGLLGELALAGIHIPSDPNPYPPPTAFSQVRLNVGEYRSILAWKDPTLPPAERGSLREQILKRMGELEAKLKDSPPLTLKEKRELTGCWLRTGQPGKVIQFLAGHRANSGDFDSVLLLSHLAMAQAEDPQLLGRAIATMEDVLDQWPEQVSGWKHEQWRWARRCEVVLLQLWKSRQREWAASGGKLPVKLDSILGLEGFESAKTFQPGFPARAVWDRLDPEAEGLVVQLLYWLPSDSRLYWAYGELLNARGEIPGAYQTLNELIAARQLSDVGPLFKHRAQLAQAIAKISESQSTEDSAQGQGNPNGMLPPGEFPMRLYLNAVGMGILIGIGITILLALQWWFLRARFSQESR